MISFDKIDYSAYDFLPCGAVIFRLEDYKIIYSNKLYNEAFADDYIKVHADDEALVKQRIDTAKTAITQQFRSVNVWDDDVYVRMHVIKDGYGNAFALIVDDTDKMIEQEELREKALIDPLSKAYNRATAIEKIKAELRVLEEYEECALIVLDIDNFKNINDTYGHVYGDAVIAMAAGSIKSILNEDDILGRFGGDEFFIFVRNIKRDELEVKLENIRLAMMKMRIDKNDENDISCSMGVAMGYAGVTYEELFTEADSALYAAKEKGKNRFEYFSGEYMNKSTLCYTSDGVEIKDENESNTEQNITTVALEIASKSPTTESAISNLMRHIGVATDLDCIQIMKFDTIEDRVSLEFQWWKDHFGEYNVVFTEAKAGYYVHNDLMIFRQRFHDDKVFCYTPDFKEGFSKKYRDVFEASENVAMVYCSNTENEDVFYVVCYQSWDKDRKWTQEEFNDMFEIMKIISMFMKSSYVVSEREKSLEQQVNYTRFGFLGVNKFYEEAGRIRREAEKSGEKMALVHFDIAHLNRFNRVHGVREGDRVLESFAEFLKNGDNDRVITSYLSGTDMYISLFRYKEGQDIRDTIEKRITEFCNSMGEYKEFPLIVKAGLCLMETGQPVARAIDVAKELKYRKDFDKPTCLECKLLDEDINV